MILLFLACQPIPVVICGLLIVRKTYTPQKYLFVLMIVSGIALFTYKGENKDKEKDLAYLGNILIGISLLMDGFKGAAQDVMRDIKRPSSLNFMFFENLWSTIFMSIILVVSGGGIEFINFCIRHPGVWKYIGAVMFCSTIGQFFITTMIMNFGSLSCIITTTLRKFFSILFSVIVFHNTLSIRQWIAAGVIFSALLLDLFFGRKPEELDECDNEETKEIANLRINNDPKYGIEMNNKVSPEENLEVLKVA